MLLFVSEPKRVAAASNGTSQSPDPFKWSGPLWAALVIVFTTIMFMVTVVQFGFLVTERGMRLPQTIGLWSAVVTVANPIGALIFIGTAARTATKLAISYALFAIGFSIMSMIPSVEAAVVGGFIANLGAGFYLPTAINLLLSTLPPALAGRGSGLWTSSVFLGQFLGPLVILGLEEFTGSLSHAILTCAALCTTAALVAVAGTLRRGIIPRAIDQV